MNRGSLLQRQHMQRAECRKHLAPLPCVHCARDRAQLQDKERITRTTRGPMDPTPRDERYFGTD